MTFAASKPNHDDTLPGLVQDGDPCKTIRLLREILAYQGLRESLCVDDEGFYFVAEDAVEITICYNAIEQNSASTRALAQRREAGLLNCCRALTQRGFTLTLFLSDRTSALFVSDG